MSPGLRRGLLYLLLAVILALHQDTWNWRDASPLFGLPVGLTYHVIYCFVVAAVLALLTRFAWPQELDHGPDETSRP